MQPFRLRRGTLERKQYIGLLSLEDVFLPQSAMFTTVLLQWITPFNLNLLLKIQLALHTPLLPEIVTLIPVCYPIWTVVKSMRGLGKQDGRLNLLTRILYWDLLVSCQEIVFQHGYSIKNCSNIRYRSSADFNTLPLVEMFILAGV